MLTPTQKQFLENTRPHYTTLVQAGFLQNIGQQEKDGLLEIARVFAPGYQANLWCSPCVCDLVKYVYTQYDKLPKELPPDVQYAGFPKQDEPVKAKRGRKAKV